MKERYLNAFENIVKVLIVASAVMFGTHRMFPAKCTCNPCHCSTACEK